MIWSAILGQLIEYAPWLIGLVGLFGAYWRGHHNGVVKAHRNTMESLAKRGQTRLEIENAIDQDADLVRRAHVSGLVRPDGK